LSLNLLTDIIFIYESPEDKMDKIIIFDKKKIKLDKEVITVGRGPDCDIHLNDEQVSRYHGKFTRRGEDLFYEDNKSSNGSYLNNKLITGKKKVKEGDVIQVSSFVLKIDLEIPTRRYPALESGAIKDGIKCPSCGKTISPNARYCVFCGSQVKKLIKQNTLPCPECGKLIPVGSKYCNHCGVDLSEETYDLDLTEMTPVFMTAPEVGKNQSDLSTIPLDELKVSSSSLAKTAIKKQPSMPKKGKKDSKKTKNPSLKIDKKQIKIEDIKSVSKISKKLASISAAKPAGFWIRTVALILDVVFFLILFFILFAAPAYFTNPFKLDFSNGINLQLFQEIHKNIRIEIYYGFAAGGFLLGFLYFVASVARNGGTPGKRIFGLYIFRKSSMTIPVGWGKAILRALSYIISTVLILMGFIIVAFKKDKRALHDIIAGTQVCHKKSK
jgi:uncharacterized RDD family membrane protein YckC/DNA-directed RNA polymerase subunit RPC12/RpoP